MAPVFIKRYGAIKGNTYLYGFKIDQRTNIINVEYIEDNHNFIPMSVGETDSNFNYGSWENTPFLEGIKPCLLNYDGTVYCYLNKNDYTKDVSGNSVNITDTSNLKNVMVEFSKNYYKIVDNGNDTANIYISNKKIDENFQNWPFLDYQANEIPFMYLSAYMCTAIVDNSLYKLRSLNNRTNYTQLSLSNCLKYAMNTGLSNGKSEDYSVEPMCDTILLYLYGLLVGCSVDFRNVFGFGRNTSMSYSNSIKTGTLNSSGMFSGAKETSPLKYFGIEDYYGLRFRKIVGLRIGLNSSNNYVFSTKLTYGMSDESQDIGYANAHDKDSYEIGDNVVTNMTKINTGTLSYCLVQKMKFSKYGLIPLQLKTISGQTVADCYYDVCQLGTNYVGGKNTSLAGIGGGETIARKYGANGYSSSSLYTAGLNSNVYTQGVLLSCKPRKVV